ncbi:phospholipase D-like domain-containing protein [[Mycoplasma] collis]|uniref:phospholipase D-like domain-containing protein n=1 Tax=[Mycoplasma] collis TaxID=2127 RepID=UPI00051C977C|nr:phospholipase D-like domain-containing protein [[Mycoplasma] collis]
MIKNKYFYKIFNAFFLLFLASIFSVMGYLCYRVIKNSANIEIIITFIIFYILNILSIIYLLNQERHIDAKISWILFIIFFPFLGQSLYVIFGRKYKKRISQIQYWQQKKNFTNYKYENENKKFLDRKLFFDQVDSIFGNSPKNFDFDFFFNGFDFYEKMFDDIEKAKKSIYIEIFIVKKSFIWQRLKDLLIKKASEGIDVNLILDGLGSYGVLKKDKKLLLNSNIKIITYNKLKFPFISARSFYRIHKKIFIIDSEIAYIGGNNIADEYSNFSAYYGIWFDTNLRLTGPLVEDITNAFIDDWNLWNKNPQEKIKKNKLQVTKHSYDNLGALFQGGPNIDISLLESHLIQLIYSAKKEIKIFSPYFIPTERIFIALKEVLISNKKVQIYVPGKFDKNYVKPFTLHYCLELQKLGAEIYIYKNSFAHSKTLIIDEMIGYIGTMNLDIRSLYSQYEINVLITGKVIEKYLKHINYLKEINVVVPFFKQRGQKKRKLNKIFVWIFKPLL